MIAGCQDIDYGGFLSDSVQGSSSFMHMALSISLHFFIKAK